MKSQITTGLALVLATTMHANAADLTTPSTPSTPEVPRPNWALQITPYMWATGLKGNISPFRRGPAISVEKSFSDVLQDLDFGGFIDIWGRYDRIVFSGDLMYVKTTESENIGRLPIIGTVRGLSASVDTALFMAKLQGGYRLYDAPDLTLDLLGGIRYWDVSNDVAIHYRGHSVSYGESFNWIDPLVGARALYRFTPDLSVMAQADIGGFSVGSKLTWQAQATVNYRLTDNIWASAGYKILDVDYRSRGHVFDTTFKGPVLGVTYRF